MPAHSLAIAGAMAAGTLVAGGSTDPSTVGLFTVAGGICVALITLAGTIFATRRGSRGDSEDTSKRLAALETWRANTDRELKGIHDDVREILEHVRPWPKRERP